MILKVEFGYQYFILEDAKPSDVEVLARLVSAEQVTTGLYKPSESGAEVSVQVLKSSQWSPIAEVEAQESLTAQIARLTKDKDAERSAKWKAEEELNKLKKKQEHDIEVQTAAAKLAGLAN